MSLLDVIAPYRLLIEIGVGLALCAGLYGYGHHQGSVSGRAEVQAKWDAAELVRIAEETKRKAENDAAGTKAATTYRRASAAITAGHEHAASTLRSALAAPACPEPAASTPTLADVRIPGPIVDILRDAAGGSGVPSEPTPRGTSRAVLSGPAVPDAGA